MCLQAATNRAPPILAPFFVEIQWVPPIVTVVAKAVLVYSAYKFMPCQHIAWVNYMRLGLYTLAFWSGICALIARGLSSSGILNSPIPLTALIAGWSVTTFFMIIFMCYGKFSTDKRKAKHARAKMRSGHIMALELTESEANMSPSLAAMGTWGKTIRAGKKSMHEKPDSPRPKPSADKVGKEEVVKHGKKPSQAPDLRDVNFEEHDEEEKHADDDEAEAEEADADGAEDDHGPEDAYEDDAGAEEQGEYDDGGEYGDGEYEEEHDRDDPYAEEQVQMQEIRVQKGGKRKG